MSSSGHIADMIVRMENNRALLKYHRRYKDIFEQYANTSLQKPLEWREMSESERKDLIAHLRQVLQDEKQNNWKARV